MKCEHCRFAPGPNSEGYYEDDCPYFDKFGTTWKDGKEGCTLHPNQLQKYEDEYAEHLGVMGTDMGFQMSLEGNGLTEEQTVKDMMHMIGLYPEGRRKSYTRHGKKFFRPYRNGWGGENPRLELACNDAYRFCRKGYFSKQESYPIYHLTREGLDWLGRQLGIYIHNEEE